ncbi:SIR2 family protein [Nocardioides marmorisolisilvae]|uniref:Uncharacterized protein n=1 Tax=Nocardioides marmorisolisilvae TaxID=1542737 RepID=A0A3N0DTF8_9ACTN|nr:SIR2 family protein [Nocardioides marmorisolisilvae]RNL78909.1 hypothetical protein EFL95_07585 [Nocardioides marmorisolisilvae]
MLMFVFGAGASYDSDPERTPLMHPSEDHRPPLATDLFAPASAVGQEIVKRYPQAGALIMRLREATRQKQDVEEVLQTIAGGEESYPRTKQQLVALSAYLADLITDVPARWADECQGLTNYVRALEEADRWNQAVHSDEPIVCITFNYDSLLEAAAESVFGVRLNSLDSYVSNADFRIYKPHGSVTWQQAAVWDDSNVYRRPDGTQRAIQLATSLQWEEDRFRYRQPDFHDKGSSRRIWMPALSIPMRRKANFTMPSSHLARMKEDLRQVTTVISVGWRARERHFLDLLQDHLGSSPAQLIAVAESVESATETVEELWKTGRFNRYAIGAYGFTGFTGTGGETLGSRIGARRDPLTLHEILTNTQGFAQWSGRDPGNGLPPDNSEIGDINSGYLDF